MTSERYQRGWEKLKEVDGDAGEKVIDSLRDIAPDLGRFTIEFPFGDIYTRPDLDLRSREIAVVAALTALGNAAPQLKVHINGALNVGVTRNRSGGDHHDDGRLCGVPGCAQRDERGKRGIRGPGQNGPVLIPFTFSYGSSFSLPLRARQGPRAGTRAP